MKMNSILYYGPNNVKYEQVDIPEINDNEVLVKIDTALTCGTDIKTYKRGHPVLIKTIPSGFGHEFSGVIAKLGKNENVTVEVLVKICAALDCKIEDIMELIPDEKPAI